MTAFSLDRNQLRLEMRAKRRCVTAAQARTSARNLTRELSRHHLLQPHRRVGVYLRQGSELDLSIAITWARRRGCDLYLPAVTHANSARMAFVSFASGAKLRRNRFGILEPDPAVAKRIPVRRLDFILLPLLAVDARGWRLGSGAGFYDRYLHHLRPGRRWRRPRLIGAAYEFQRIPHLEPSAWDVPLDALVTDRGFHAFSRSAGAI